MNRLYYLRWLPRLVRHLPRLQVIDHQIRNLHHRIQQGARLRRRRISRQVIQALILPYLLQLIRRTDPLLLRQVSQRAIRAHPLPQIRRQFPPWCHPTLHRSPPVPLQQVVQVHFLPHTRRQFPPWCHPTLHRLPRVPPRQVVQVHFLPHTRR